MIASEENISHVVRAGLCNQCGTCFSICPSNCISVIRDKFNNYVPTIDYNVCTRCKLCIKVCPGLEVKFSHWNVEDALRYENRWDSNIGNYKKTFLGYSTNEEIRVQASSGGIVPAITISLLESGVIDGAIVVGSGAKNPFNPQVFIAQEPYEIFNSMQSKYHPVFLNAILKDINMNSGKYAFVGLPCHIHGLRKYQKYKSISNKIFITIGLFCGLNLRFDSLEFLCHRVHKDFEELRNVSYRDGKWPGKTVLSFLNDKKFIVDKNMINHIFTLPRCIYCIDHTSEMADISCGDAWLKEVVEKNDNGWSAIVSRSSRGNEILEQLQRNNKLYLEDIGVDKIKESQYPMLCFKKKSSWMRIEMSKYLGRKVPRYEGCILRKSLNINYFVGNIILLIMVHLMKSERFKCLVMKTPFIIINLYKKLILKLLYRDSLIQRIGKKLNRIVSVKL